MKKWIKRLTYGILFAIPMMLVTYAFVQAAPREQVEVPEGELDCRECHQAFYDAWNNSSHGRATSDQVFQEAWQEQGSPGDCLSCHATGYDPDTGTYEAEGITCEVCHSPVTVGHPLAPMAADRSAKLCGECHTEMHFEWQVSAHRENGVDCSVCHNPHATDLKADDPSLLCASCHRDRASNFAHSAHNQEGLSCADCHLVPTNRSGMGGHACKDHTFFVNLTACNNCHAYQMHDPVEVHVDEQVSEPLDAMVAVEDVEVMADPIPVSPMGFTALSGLIGVALGVIIAPWIDRLQRKSRFFDEEEGK